MEYWRFIKDCKSRYGRYRVSNLGRVKNGLGNESKPHKHKKGYVLISLTYDGKEKRRQLHRLVALAWIPNPDNLPQVNHKDGDKKNNRVSNLEWCTNLQNMQHAWSTGLMSNVTGGIPPVTYGLIPDEHVREIRNAKVIKGFGSKNAETNRKELAKKYGVSIHVIKDIRLGKSYRHVK